MLNADRRLSSSLQVRSAADEHLGLLGPTIRAEVGDEIHVVFSNRMRYPASVHSHGVLYNKSSEGSPYDDGTSGECLCFHVQLRAVQLQAVFRLSGLSGMA